MNLIGNAGAKKDSNMQTKVTERYIFSNHIFDPDKYSFHTAFFGS